MTPTTSQHASEIADLRSNVRQLQQTIALLEDERDELIRRRFRRLLIFGVGISLVLHISLMIYLSRVGSGGGGSGGGTRTMQYEFAVVNEGELAGPEGGESFDELDNDEAAMLAGPVDQVDLAQGTPSAEAGLSGDQPTIGVLGGGGAGGVGFGGEGGTGSGGGDGLGLGGGGGSASFFGTGGKGQRFAYIVDISGSMANDRKFERAMGELARSIEALPDFAQFHIILFQSETIQPPVQSGWLRARKATVRQVIRWLSDVEPNGGTEPRKAFLQVFSLDNRPDVIFFLTDGIFNDVTPDEVAALNARGKRSVINTIGFGMPGEVDQAVLRAMASASGGQYRFVPTEAGP